MTQRRNPRAPLNPAEHITAIKSTGAFREVMSKSPLEQMDEQNRRRTINNAISHSAFFLANEMTQESGYRSPEGDRFEMIGQLEPFYAAQKSLNRIREQEERQRRAVPFAMKEPHLLQVIDFNHSVKKVIDSDPSLSFQELLGFATRMYAGANHPSTVADFQGEFRSALNGMRHELGAEQLIGELGLDYDETDRDGELLGEDIIVYLDGKVIPVDIKASAATTERSRNKSRHPERIIWSQLKDEDFGNGFRIPPAVAARKAPAMMYQLQAAAAKEPLAV